MIEKVMNDGSIGSTFNEGIMQVEGDTAYCVEISKAIQDEVYAGVKAFVKANKERYDCGGYIYSCKGQELGQFWAKLAAGNVTEFLLGNYSKLIQFLGITK